MKLYPFLILILLGACKNDGTTTTVAKSGSDNSGLSKLDRQIEKSPEDDKLLYERAKTSYERNNYDQVINDLTKAVEIDSLVPEYYHLLSDAYLDYYRSRDALNTMTTAGELFPKRIPTLLKLCEMEYLLEQYDKSLLTVAKILTYSPGNAEGHFMTGMNFRAMGEVDRAIGAFIKATESDPELLDAWLMTGDLFEAKGEEIALRYYEGAIDVAPDNPKTWHSKAFYLQNNNDDEGALEIYRKINLIDRNYTDAYLNAGILYLSRADLGAAKEQFDILIGLDPKNHHAYYYRGLIHEEEGDIKSARDYYQNSLNFDPEYTPAKKAITNLANS